jgi:hypothetical protein
MHLAVTVQAIGIVQESDAMDLDLTAERDENGDVTVVATIDSENPLLNDGEMEGFFEAFGEALLEVTFEMTVTPQGKVLEATVDGDPFADLPADSPVLEMTLKTLELMFSAEDLAAIAAGEMFLQLSPEPVSPGDDWPVVREMNVAGLGLSGTGTTRFEALEREGEAAVAVLVEETDYEIDAAGLSVKMDELTQLIFDSMEVEMDTAVDLVGEDYSVESEVRFDVAGGYPRHVTWAEQTLVVEGTMDVGPQTLDLTVVTEVSKSTARWELEEAPEER